MPSEGLFDGIFSRGGAADAVTGRAWLQAMLDVEAALARACARANLIPQSAAEAIAAACLADRYDVGEIARAAAASATPVIPLVAALRAAVGEPAAEHVHRGARSQDVIDTAAMLVAGRALRSTLAALAAAADASAHLAEAHRRTPILGRTLLQPAEPTTFGLKAAGWLVGIDEARAALEDVRAHILAVQLGGAAGTLAAFEGRGAEIAADVARQLDLAEPVLPWHAIRTRPAQLAGALGATAGVLGKVAVDVALLAQGEVGEVREGRDAARGGSSAMPHKRNPVGAVSVRACAERVPGLVATLLAAMRHEHERAAGPWQAEWETLSELLRVVGAEAAWAAELLDRLEVDAERMRMNLEASGVGLSSLASQVDAAAALVDRALAAHHADVERSCTGGPR